MYRRQTSEGHISRVPTPIVIRDGAFFSISRDLREYLTEFEERNQCPEFHRFPDYSSKVGEFSGFLCCANFEKFR